MLDDAKHLSLFCLLLCIGFTHLKKPHIVMIIADDLGWNDVSFHGSEQIPTPNIDKLAHSGVILNNYYVLPICSPTRSAIMTGRYPIHTGMQEDVIIAPNAWGVGLNETFLPQYLKSQGYQTHAVGKWHLGFYAKEYTPTYRGFDSHYGYYLGKGDYYDHSDDETYWGLDLHDNEKPVFTQWGNYSTEMYTSVAEERIREHNISEPLFLYLAYQAVHSANPNDPLQAPQKWIDRYKHIKHEKRRKYAAVLGYMDYGIGRIHQALADKGILDNTIIVFTTDNGGPANGFDMNWANNFPLRGVKATLFEGGVRATGFVYSKLLNHPGTVSNDLMHVTDWLPTFVRLAGGSTSVEDKLDGVDQWDTIQNKLPSQRNEILLNIDLGVWKNAALRVGDWKIIHEGKYWDQWYPPPMFTNSSKEMRSQFEEGLTVKCGGHIPTNITHCGHSDSYFCLFNLREDPCEFNDVSKVFPEVLEKMKLRLREYELQMVSPRNNFTDDPLSNPKLHSGVWEPWIQLE